MVTARLNRATLVQISGCSRPSQDGTNGVMPAWAIRVVKLQNSELAPVESLYSFALSGRAKWF